MMWQRRTESDKRLHEFRVVRTLLRYRGITPASIRNREEPHPDVHTHLGREEVDFEVTDAVPEAALTSLHAHDRFQEALIDAAAELSAAEREIFETRLDGRLISAHFRGASPARSSRAIHARALLAWLMERPAGKIANLYEFDANGTTGIADAGYDWSPPIPGLSHLFVNRLGEGIPPQFSKMQMLTWDPGDVVRNVIAKKLTKRYSACAPRELAVYLDFLPARWERRRLQDEFDSELRRVGFRAVWFVTREKAVGL